MPGEAKQTRRKYEQTTRDHKKKIRDQSDAGE